MILSSWYLLSGLRCSFSSPSWSLFSASQPYYTVLSPVLSPDSEIDFFFCTSLMRFSCNIQTIPFYHCTDRHKQSTNNRLHISNIASLIHLLVSLLRPGPVSWDSSTWLTAVALPLCPVRADLKKKKTKLETHWPSQTIVCTTTLA